MNPQFERPARAHKMDSMMPDSEQTRSSEQVFELQRLGEGYKNEIKNPQRERQTIEALMKELSGEK
jgi:hypothetical protein